MTTAPNASMAIGVITAVDMKTNMAERAESSTKTTAPATACCWMIGAASTIAARAARCNGAMAVKPVATMTSASRIRMRRRCWVFSRASVTMTT